ncbi:hypothetical protein Tsubulata_040375 [Turnera subulata]|uniref:Uncharacterized protein n=1 Tax=Turnera subulata TaxID=218843 RepID=A0A9Q0FG57_9ROSI|nr:hypothetical protein Tsubulata_040375 [Turnera subulata]
MGKNQAYKAMQRARLGSTSAGPEEIEDGMSQVDGSFHTPEWQAARLASLKTSHTITWEEYKRKQKEDEMKKGELEADAERMMREYRAKLDAERAIKLAQGRNHSSSKSSHKRDKKDRESKRRSSKKRKDCFFLFLFSPEKNLRHHGNFPYFSGLSCAIDVQHSKRKSSDSGSSDYSSSDDEEKESRRSKSRSKRMKNSGSSDSSSSDDEERDSRRSKSRSKKLKKDKKHKSRSKHSSSDDEDADGPVPLSRFFGKMKS